jgi:DNA-directed RNA polymerase specialized sigma24 family protein
VSQPLTGQRHRAEVIAELYDRYAAGLFAYCADQLGDLGSASDVLVAVLTSVPDAEPPRAALYALARREIHRRDVTYSPPAVDALVDPASALVERTLRELRPHQREVLMLCAVCGLSKAELAWVLDVAPDTAGELAVGAGHRFRQALGTALLNLGARVPSQAADVYGALGIAPLDDVLRRLPWPAPPGGLRVYFAGSRSPAPGPLFVKPRWPAPPVWPQPLAKADPASSTVIFPAELMSPPAPSRVPVHDATTAPMPKVRDRYDPLDTARPLRDPLGSARPLRDPLDTGRSVRDPLGASRPLWEQPFFLSAPDDPDDLGPFATGDVILPKDSLEPFATGDVILPKDALEPYVPGDVFGDVLVHKGPARPVQEPPPFAEQPPGLPSGWAGAQPLSRVDVRPAPWAPLRQSSRPEEPLQEAAPLFKPRAKPGSKSGGKHGGKPGGKRGGQSEEPVYRLPMTEEPREEPPVAEPFGGPSLAKPSLGRPSPGEPGRLSAGGPLRAGQGPSSMLDPRPIRARPMPKRRPVVTRRPQKQRRRRDRHYDWAWELIGFLVCVVIAMIVFFSVPIFID